MQDFDENRPKPNPNHPRPGDTIKVEPIRTVNGINKIKNALAPSPRNLALFVVGINTAYRASELLSIRLRQIRHLQPGDRLEIKQKKTKKYRAVTLNNSSVVAIQGLLQHLDRKALKMKDLTWVDDDSYLFAGMDPRKSLTVPYLNNLVKKWCRQSNLKGNYGSRELAILIWAAVLSVWVLSKKDLRSSIKAVALAFLSKHIIRIVLLMIVYIVTMVYILTWIGLWESRHIKNTIVWTASVAALMVWSEAITVIESLFIVFSLRSRWRAS